MPAHVGHADASLEQEKGGDPDNDVRIHICDFHWHTSAAAVRQAVACFKKKQKGRRSRDLASQQGRSPTTLPRRGGSGGNGGLSRDVSGPAPKIRRYGPCHSFETEKTPKTQSKMRSFQDIVTCAVSKGDLPLRLVHPHRVERCF